MSGDFPSVGVDEYRDFLKDLVSRKDLISRDITGDDIAETFCNYAVQAVCKKFGCDSLNGLTANGMCNTILHLPDEWYKISGLIAHGYANMGRFVIAALANKPQGHVATIYPSDMMAVSGKWRDNPKTSRGKVPMCANVGPKNSIIGVNWAFREVPDYYSWRGV